MIPNSFSLQSVAKCCINIAVVYDFKFYKDIIAIGHFTFLIYYPKVKF